MIFFAWKNLIKERTRLVLTLVGITFAVVLMFFDLGVYLGFVRASTILIDNAQADIWVTIKNNPNFDSARPFPERKLWQVRQVPGVQWAEPVAKSWAVMKLANGTTDTVMMVGFDPESGVGWPWKMQSGSVSDLKVNNTIIFDESASDKLGGLAIGDRLEILDTQVKVVALSQEARTFTTYPVAFTNYLTAKNLSVTFRQSGADNTTFILVKAAPDVPVDRVIANLKRTISDVDVFSKEELAWNTRRYWILQTGMGIGFGIVALLSFLIGTVIVGQTIYTSTLERLREFGTLKAMGATNRDVMTVIVSQALINAIVGFVIACGLVVVASQWYRGLGLNMVTSSGLQIAMFGITVAMCLLASILSIRKAFSVDPAIVFRV